MATTTGTSNNDSWSLTGYYSGTLDGLAGTDTLSLGTLQRSSFTLTQNSDGSIQLDTVAGASGAKASHILLYNMEVLKYNSNRAQFDLTNYFPKITDLNPVDGSTKVPVDSNIILTFNKSISKGNGNITIHSGSATGPVFEAFSTATSNLLDFSNNTLTINPDINFKDNTHYYITIANGAIKDASGNAFLDNISYEFTTAAASTQDTSPPVITGFSPADGSTNVANNSNLVVSFNEAIAFGKGTIQLHIDSPTGTVVGSYDVISSPDLVINGTTLTINPSVNLNSNTHYYLTLDAGAITDLAGNAYSGTNAYDFITAAATGPVLPAATITTVIKNTLTGTAGNDVFDGTAQDSSVKLIGLAGDDTYIVNDKNAKIVEAANKGIDTVYAMVSFVLGNNIENVILTGTNHIDAKGNKLNNVLTGNSGNNVLDGGLGNDTLTGGDGADIFKFATAPNATKNVDTVTDFKHGVDKIELDSTYFKTLKGLTLSNANLVTGSGDVKALDANDYLLFDSTSGALFYDADGSGKQKPVEIAIIGTPDHAELAYTDFTII